MTALRLVKPDMIGELANDILDMCAGIADREKQLYYGEGEYLRGARESAERIRMAILSLKEQTGC